MKTSTIDLKTRLFQALQRGLNFLSQQQNEDGSWSIVYGSTPDLTPAKPLTEVFTVAYIVREIAGWGGEFYAIYTMLDKAVSWLESQRRSDGLWKYYRKGDLRLLPNDFDTTSCTMAALLLAGRQVEVSGILQTMESYRHPDGGYWTYAMPPIAPSTNWIYPIHQNFYPEYIINAHILYFLVVAQADYQTQYEQYKFVQRLFDEQAYERPQLFYDSPLLFLYNMAKALEKTVWWEIGLQKRVKQDVWHYFSKHSLLNRVLVVGTLYRLKASWDIEDSQKMETAVNAILDEQGRDGGWEQDYYYITPISYHGCREVVTSLALNSLYTVYMSLDTQ